MASLVAQTVKNPTAMRETQVRSLGWGRSPGGGNGNPLNSTATERIPRTEEPGQLQSMWLQRVGRNWATNTQSRWHGNCEGRTDRTWWHVAVEARGTGLGWRQGFLVWPTGQGRWCSYDQKREINLLIEQLLQATHPQPFAVPLLARLYHLLTFRDWKSQIFPLPNFPCS